jgi:predicted DNA-binding transcriptional regulator AlpA
VTKLVSAKELATMLGVTRSWVNDRRRRGKIPSVDLGYRTVRYDPGEVLRVLRERADVARIADLMK